jgi:type IV pilus assembly protein PilY1
LLTGFEKDIARSYVDTNNVTQSTSGNPNTRPSLPEMSSNGTGIDSAWYWAAAAYWANTRPIRNDTKLGKSMSDVRVKTFTIDVDEGGNGSIEDDNPRGRKPRSSAAYLAGKYGWFNDANGDGHPFRTTGGQYNNSEWEDSAAPNTPAGYVLAGQAQKMLDAIRKFFKSATADSGTLSVSAVSSQRFTTNDPNGDLYEPRFNSIEWSGSIIRRKLALDTTTLSLNTAGTETWNTGAILTAASLGTATSAGASVIPADRKIFTMTRDTLGQQGIAFTAANLSVLDNEVRTALNTNPASSPSVADNKGAERINWLRGYRNDEKSSTGGFLRARSNIHGDVINSGPVYKEGADEDVIGEGYAQFAQTVKSRTPVVYVGANDGMFHAFRATDGKELFAYVPRAVSANLHHLTNPTYKHRPYVDGVPTIGEALVGSSWKTLAVSGMGGGANGIFALDVTNPDSFGASNVMFEFTDRDDPDIGNIIRQPKLVKMRMAGTGTPVYKWFVAVGSGYNNYASDGYASTTGAQALFLLSVDKNPSDAWSLNSNYFKILLSSAGTTQTNALSNPGIAKGSFGEAVAMYAGDLQGNMWKFDFASGLNGTNGCRQRQRRQQAAYYCNTDCHKWPEQRLHGGLWSWQICGAHRYCQHTNTVDVRHLGQSVQHLN